MDDVMQGVGFPMLMALSVDGGEEDVAMSSWGGEREG